MPTYKLIVEYEGTRYRGWQEQQNARTVSGELRHAIERVAGPVQDLGGSGRTDAGVHAAAQVAHLRLARPMEAEPLRLAVNELLPADIHILAASRAHDRFHARHEAVSRTYLYQVALRRTAFAKKFVWWVKRPLDAELVRGAAALLPGRHDFAMFCERPSEQPSTLVVVEGVEVARAGALLLLRLTASHFLWKMVRRLVGTLVEVGAGELSQEWFEELLGAQPGAGRLVNPAQWTAPPSGLFLERVIYAGDPPLPPIAPLVPVEPEPIPAASAAPRGPRPPAPARGIRRPQPPARRGPPRR
jgi:tRNA pseudouridine38-40 synthase